MSGAAIAILVLGVLVLGLVSYVELLRETLKRERRERIASAIERWQASDDPQAGTMIATLQRQRTRERGSTKV